jgi:hypothetical protein
MRNAPARYADPGYDLASGLSVPQFAQIAQLIPSPGGAVSAGRPASAIADAERFRRRRHRDGAAAQCLAQRTSAARLPLDDILIDALYGGDQNLPRSSSPASGAC